MIKGGKRFFLRAAPILLFFLACACQKDAKSLNRSTGTIGAPSLPEGFIGELDKDGNPTKVEGYNANTSVMKGGKISTESFVNQGAKDSKVFDFKTPEGYEAQFSAPIPIVGSYLTADFSDCSEQAYQPSIPVFGDVLEYMRNKNLCNNIAFNFCVKLSPTHSSLATPIYFKTPRIDMMLACPAETFAKVSFAIDKASQTASGKVNLLVTAPDTVADMYITNSSPCIAGGSWEGVVKAKASWQLDTSVANPKVFARFRDVIGNLSTCMEDSTKLASSNSVVLGSIYGGHENLLTLAYPNSETVVASACKLIGLDKLTESTPCSCKTGVCTVGVTPTSGYSGDVTINYTVTVNGEASGSLTATLKVRPASLAIDQGPYTNSSTVSLSLDATDATEMFITNTPGCSSGGSWESYASSKANWALSQMNASNTVYAQFKDTKGSLSACLAASIVNDMQAPTGGSISINSGATHTSATNVSLSLAASDSNSLSMYVTNTAGCSANGTWESFATSKAWTLGQTNSTALVYVKFKDAAGNESGCISGSIIHDSQAPTSPSIAINSNDTYTATASVTLTLNATGASDMYITNTASCVSGGTWESYATSKVWSLGQTNTLATVYVKFRDTALNESTCISDGITHDGSLPSDPASFDDGTLTTSGTSSPSMSWTASTDSGSGIAGYQIAIGTSAGTSDIKAWTNVGNVTSTSITGLNLSKNTTYFGSIRALDIAGNPSSIVNGDGFTLKAWTQQAYIKASNSESGDGFGSSIALSSETLAVGASGEDSDETTVTNGPSGLNNSNPESGAVYVYKRTGTTWAQEAYIKASNNDSNDRFGGSVTLDSDTLAVGASSESSNQTTITNGTTSNADNSSPTSGAVYIYKRTGTSWAQEAYVKATNADGGILNVTPGDNFGHDVALSSDTLAVLAPGEDSNQTTITNGTTASPDNSADGRGAVYIYKRAGVLWAQEAYIKPVANTPSSYEVDVALSSDTLAVGYQEDNSDQTTITNGTGTGSDGGTGFQVGSVFVYKRTGTTWEQEAYVKPINVTAGDQKRFGRVALFSDTLAVGAYLDSSSQTSITNGTTASTDTTNLGAGAIFVYKRAGVTWAQEAYIKASNNAGADYFGYSVALSSDTLAAGKLVDSSNQTSITNGTSSSTDGSSPGSGAVFVYKRTATAWAQEAYIKASNANGGDYFGKSIALSSDTLAVVSGDDSNETTITNGTTASTDNSNTDSGAVYIYTR